MNVGELGPSARWIYLDSSYLDLSWDPWDEDHAVASYQEDPGLQAVRQEVRRWDLQDLAVSVPSFEVPGVIVHLVVLDHLVEQDLSSQETLEHLDRVVLDLLVSFPVSFQDLPPVASVVLVALLQLEAVVASVVVVAVVVVLVALVVAAVVPVALVAVAAVVPVASAVAEVQVVAVAAVVVQPVLAAVAVVQVA